MNIELTDNELEIIKKALKDLIDKDGISDAQQAFLHNIDKGMSYDEAEKQFQVDNRKDWAYMIYDKKDPLYSLFDRLFLKDLKI